MNRTDNIYDEAVRAVVGWLRSKGHPSDRILEEYKEEVRGDRQYFYDIVVLDANRRVKEFYEIKTARLQSGEFGKKIEKANEFRAQIQNMASNDALGYLVLYDSNEHDFSLILLSRTISNLSDYVRVISDSHHDEGEYSYFFRGQDSLSYELKPSLYRKPGLPAREVNFLKEAIRRCPGEFEGQSSTFQKLVKLQHYGCPTRLLDLTSNALVALYFAVENLDKDEDAAVFSFKVSKSQIKSYDSDSVSVVSNLARLPHFKINPKVKKFNRTIDALYLLHEIQYEKPQFRPLIDPKDLQTTFCVLPKLDNPRIRQQNGAFFLFGIGNDKNACSKLDEHPVGIIVEASNRQTIKNELSLFGITDSYMYPEIDHVLKEIKGCTRCSE